MKFERLFPMMIDNFEDYTRIISNIKLSPENRALLIQIINPTNTPEYKALKKLKDNFLVENFISKFNYDTFNELKDLLLTCSDFITEEPILLQIETFIKNI